MDIRDPEFQALLSAYAMGTLTDGERTRLFAKALDNQALFDALMDEQALKDTLDHPLVRRALLRAIEEVREEQPLFAAASALAPLPASPAPVQKAKTPRMIWIAGASAAALGLLLLVFVFRVPELPQREETKQIALKTGIPPSTPAAAPAPAIVAAPKRAITGAVKSEVAKVEALAPAAEVERKEERPAAPAANSFSGPAAADRAEKLESFARRSSPSPLNVAAEIIRENDGFLLRVTAPSSGFLYAFAEAGATWQPVSAPGANIWRAGEQKSVPLGPLASGTEIRLFFSPARDEQLELALADPRLLPQRQWTSLRVPR